MERKVGPFGGLITLDLRFKLLLKGGFGVVWRSFNVNRKIRRCCYWWRNGNERSFVITSDKLRFNGPYVYKRFTLGWSFSRFTWGRILEADKKRSGLVRSYKSPEKIKKNYLQVLKLSRPSWSRLKGYCQGQGFGAGAHQHIFIAAHQSPNSRHYWRQPKSL